MLNGIKFVFGFVCLILVTNFFNTAYADSLANYLTKISKINSTIRSKYSVNLIVNNSEVPIWQTLEIKNCQVSLKTYGETGLLFQDFYNLTKSYPHRRLFKYKGTYGISFGASTLTLRSSIYFQTKDKRKETFYPLREIAKICHKNEVKAYYINSSKPDAPNLEPPEFDGSIPTLNNTMPTKIHSEKNQNYLAPLKGELSFLQRYRSIISAKSSILAQYLIFRADETGKFFSNLLMQKKLQGLDVHVIVDGFFNSDAQQGKIVQKNLFRMYNNLMASGIRVFGYSCLGKFIRNEFNGVSFSRLISRSHEKMWIVDGDLAEQNGYRSAISPSSMGIIGGLNISQEYFHILDSGKDNWRDQDIEMRGPVVNDLYRMFMRNKQVLEIKYKSYNYDKYCYNPYDPVKNRQQYLSFKEKHTQPFLPLSDEESKTALIVQKNMKKIITGDIGELNLDGSSKISYPDYSYVNKVLFLNNRPMEYENYIFKAYLDMINNAKEEVLIANSYFLPPPLLREAIKNAANRGVKVTILTNSPKNNDVPFINIVGGYYFIEMLQGNWGFRNLPGIPIAQRGPEELKIYEWLGKKSLNEHEDKPNYYLTSTAPGVTSLGNFYSGTADEEVDEDDDALFRDAEESVETAKTLTQEETMLVKENIQDGLMHSKYMLIDRNSGIVGSFNLDSSSLINSESALIFEGKNLTESFRKIFKNDLLYSQRLNDKDIEDYRNPPTAWIKFKLWLGKLVENYL